MGTPSELIQQMIVAHNKGDDDAFVSAAQRYASEERRKNHHVVANEVERIISGGRLTSLSPAVPGSMLGIREGELPRDRERGTPLVEIIEPHRHLDDLVLAPATLESLSTFVRENRHAELLQSYGLRAESKALFCGPPGCGKTVAAECLAHALYLPLVLVRIDAVVSSYLGETASNLRKIFDFAQTRPMVVFFDEFDAIGKRRTAEEDHGELKRVVNSFLQLVDRFSGESIIVAATNHQGLLDPAIWRRFDDIVFFGLPDIEAIRELLIRNMRQMGWAPQIDLDIVALNLVGMSFADVERVARDAVKDSILSDRSQVELDTLNKAIIRQLQRAAITDQSTATLNRAVTSKTARGSTTHPPTKGRRAQKESNTDGGQGF